MRHLLMAACTKGPCSRTRSLNHAMATCSWTFRRHSAKRKRRTCGGGAVPARVSIAMRAERRCRAHQSATACPQPAKRRRVPAGSAGKRDTMARVKFGRAVLAITTAVDFLAKSFSSQISSATRTSLQPAARRARPNSSCASKRHQHRRAQHRVGASCASLFGQASCVPHTTMEAATKAKRARVRRRLNRNRKNAVPTRTLYAPHGTTPIVDGVISAGEYDDVCHTGIEPQTSRP